MAKLFPYKAGKTLGSDEKFLAKLIKRGAKTVNSEQESDFIIVFCPIVSRYETDINSALSSVKEHHSCDKGLILVAMHHTFDKDYTLPMHREPSSSVVTLQVDCLFFETKGLLSCSCNKTAVKTVCKTLNLKKHPHCLGLTPMMKKGSKEKHHRKGKIEPAKDSN